MDSPDRPLPAGYEFTKVLGAGHFGEVVLARHAELKRLAAIKVIPGASLRGEDSTEQFEDESKRLLRTQSRAVLRVYETCRSGDDLLVVMEYARGRTLDDILSSGPMAADKGIVVLADVADALETAAARGVIHGDLKATDVFVTPNGHAKLGGFGMNRLVSGAPADPSRTAPELAQGGDADERSDAYAFAVLARGVLAGRRSQETQLAPSLGRKDALRPSPIPPGFPPTAASALKSGMHRNPANRTAPSELVHRFEAVAPEDWPVVEVIASRPRAASKTETPAKEPKAAKVKEPKAKGARVKPPGPKEHRQKKVKTPRGASPNGRRTRKRSWRRIAGIAVVVLAVLAAGGFGMRWFLDQQGPLAVDSVRVSVRPASAKIGCPGGTFTFLGAIHTRGGKGTVTYQWTRPNGTKEPARTVPVAKGQRTTSARLSFTASGAAVFTGIATLEVLKPAAKGDGQRFTYACSG